MHVRRSINSLMGMLFRSGAWLTSSEALEIADLGLLALRAQYRCAEISMAACEPRFPLHAKPHMLYHSFKFLQQWSRDNEWLENPLVDATQIDESFVGIISRFSRRVSPRMTIHRTYDLYLASLRRHLRDDDEWERCEKKLWIRESDKKGKQPENCENLLLLRESRETTGELQE
jgi:hypothetical protein